MYDIFASIKGDVSIPNSMSVHGAISLVLKVQKCYYMLRKRLAKGSSETGSVFRKMAFLASKMAKNLQKKPKFLALLILELQTCSGVFLTWDACGNSTEMLNFGIGCFSIT